MQELVAVGMGVGEYARARAHDVVGKPARCRGCQGRGFHRHGIYVRWVGCAEEWRIEVARFLCVGCGRTTSRLPRFALPYRLVGLGWVEVFFRGRGLGRVERYRDLLAGYWKTWRRHWPRLRVAMGGMVGRWCSRDPCEGWEQLAGQPGGVEATHQRLIETIGWSLFGHYKHLHARPGSHRY